MHLFLECHIARAVWREASWPCLVDVLLVSNFHEFISLITSPGAGFRIASQHHRSFTLCTALVLNQLWFSCNQAVHQQVVVTPYAVLEAIRRRFLEHSAAWSDSDSLHNRVWTPPPPGFFKCNTDIDVGPSFSSLAVSFQDQSRSLCSLYMEQVVSRDPLFGETCALLSAASFAQANGWDSIIFESDCQVLCNLVLDSSVTPGWMILERIAPLRVLFLDSLGWSLSWIP